MVRRIITNLEERLDYIEFRQHLLFNNDSVSRLIFEYQLTENEYHTIMDLMDNYRERIENKEKISSSEYESRIYEIVPELNGDYHFCEYIAKAFMEEGRWEEVFPALYGDNPKYSYLVGKNNV